MIAGAASQAPLRAAGPASIASVQQPRQTHLVAKDSSCMPAIDAHNWTTTEHTPPLFARHIIHPLGGKGQLVHVDVVAVGAVAQVHLQQRPAVEPGTSELSALHHPL